MTKMKKLLGMIMLSVLLSGCEPSTTEISNEYIMPPGLEDCKLYSMFGSGGQILYVMRCPDTTTTTNAGKHKKSVVTFNQ